MRINRVMAGAVASVLAFGAVAPAFADNDHRRGHDRREWREDRREWRQDRRDWERDRREARRDWERDRRDWHRDHDRYYRPAPPTARPTAPATAGRSVTATAITTAARSMW